MIAKHIRSTLLPLEADYIADSGDVFPVTIERTHPEIDAALVVHEDGTRKLVPCGHLRSRGDIVALTGFVAHKYRIAYTRRRPDKPYQCSHCGVDLTDDTATPSQVRRGGWCRTCVKEASQRRRA